MKLRGKAAVVTGAGSGVGRAASVLFAREGAAVECVDIDAAYGLETVDIIRALGGNADFIEADMGDASTVERMAAKCMERHHRIHVLFNNAATLIPGSLETFRLEDWNRQLAVNLTGPCLASAHLLPALKAAQGASIVNHGSIDGALGAANILGYSVSKGGLITLTRVLAHSLARYAIRVNCINSGSIRSSSPDIPVRFTEDARRGLPMKEGFRNATPMGRSASAEECAAAALFLACDDSSYCTGSVLTMDGGRTAVTPGATAQ